jgi:membrane protein YqaA with SNARE-associated domain
MITWQGSATKPPGILAMKKLLARLEPAAHRPLFPLLGGIVALFATVSAVAFVPILCALVALNRHRWRSTTFSCALGSASGAALLAYLIGYFGYQVVSEHLPHFVASHQWQGTAQWVARFGFLALTTIAALPITHTPALIFCALLGMPPLEVFVSFLIGKGIKYAVCAAFTMAALNHATELRTKGANCDPARE